jgi:hypothetical protein
MTFPFPFFCPSVAAVGPIGTPVGIGSLNKDSSSALTAVITTTGNIVSGDLVVIAVSCLLSGSISSISDGTNSYALAGTAAASNGSGRVEIWYKGNCTAVSSGASVTVTFSGSTQYVSAGIARVPNAKVAPLDKSANGTALPVATGVLSFADEVVFGAVGGFNFTGVSPESTGFTTIYTINNAGQVSGNFAYDAVGATTSVSYNPTVTGSGGNLVYAVASFS